MRAGPVLGLSLAMILASGGAALAHHSGAMFDRTKTITLKGTIKAFNWTNPHTWTYILAPNAEGGTDEWAIEGGSPNILARVDARWTKGALKPGDQITMTINPVKDGRKVGVMNVVTYASGETLKGAGL
jgi:hypothetical protein